MIYNQFQILHKILNEKKIHFLYYQVILEYQNTVQFQSSTNLNQLFQQIANFWLKMRLLRHGYTWRKETLVPREPLANLK